MKRTIVVRRYVRWNNKNIIAGSLKKIYGRGPFKVLEVQEQEEDGESYEVPLEQFGSGPLITVELGRSAQKKWKIVKQTFSASFFIPAICPLCQGSKKIFQQPKRTIGYTLTPGETIDEQIVPCPLCSEEEP